MRPKMWRTCPRCKKPVPPGGRCQCSARAASPAAIARAKERDRGRDRSAEPWRKAYGGAEYRANREHAIASHGGKCARCGKPVAVRQASGKWRMLPGCGVHHAKPLRSGGGNRGGNLVPLCGRCHALADAALRRRDARRSHEE